MTNNPKNNLRVLVFDSGVGGLSIYKSVRAFNPTLSFSYLFDNAGFPYGTKSDEVVVQRTYQLIDKLCQRQRIDLIIIACNTASTVALPTLRKYFSQPIIGVVPAIKPAAALTKNRVLGLLATDATIKRSYTSELISKFASHCRVELLGSAKLVELVEDKLRGQRISVQELQDIFVPWSELANFPDTIILGCTHFPLIADELKSILPHGTQLVDSGYAIGQRVRYLLEQSHKKFDDVVENNNIAYCSDYNERALLLLTTLKRYGFSNLLQQKITFS